MSAGFSGLFLPIDLKNSAGVAPPSPSSSSFVVPSANLLAGETFSAAAAPSPAAAAEPSALAARMRGQPPEVRAGSMLLRRIRCGFGVKYFGFLHIRRSCFFFLT